MAEATLFILGLAFILTGVISCLACLCLGWAETRDSQTPLTKRAIYFATLVPAALAVAVCLIGLAML